MQNIMQRTLLLVVCSLFIGSSFAQSVVDEVVWVVGDEPILKSDIEAMKDTIRKLVKISMENPEIKELEINPVIVGDEGKGCWAVDALVTLV